MPQGEPIAAEKLLEDLREGKSVDLQGKIIEGSLDADPYWGPAGERKSSLRVVRGKLTLDSCRVTGRIYFPRSVFVQDIILSCAEILGDLDLTDSEVRGSLLADRARIVGDVRLTNANVEKSLSFKKSVLEGRLDMSGARLHVISLQASELERSLDMIDSMTGAVDLSLAKIAGPVKMQDALLLGALNARGATFGGTLTLSSVRSSGSIDLRGGSAAAAVSFFDVSVENDLLLPDITLGGPVDLISVAVGHDLSLADGLFRDVKINGLTVRGASDLQGGHYPGRLEIGDSDFGKRFSAMKALFSGTCEFRRVRFPGEDPMAGARFVRAPTIIETRLLRIPIISSATEAEPEPEQSGDEEP